MPAEGRASVGELLLPPKPNPLALRNASPRRTSFVTPPAPPPAPAQPVAEEKPPPLPPKAPIKPKFASMLKEDQSDHELYSGEVIEDITGSFYGEDFVKKENTSGATAPEKSKALVDKVKVEEKKLNMLSTLTRAVEFETPAIQDLIREGSVTKISGGGNETLYHFRLTSKVLTYTELSNIGNPDKLRLYDLTKLMAL
jgi:hypothetical protein